MDWSVIWVGVFGLAGTVVGALASFLGAFYLSNRERSAERDRVRVEARGAALQQWIDAMIAVADDPGAVDKDGVSPRSRLNQADVRLRLCLTASEQRVVDYIQGVTMEVLRNGDVPTRMGTINHGGQELIDWHRGVESEVGLAPFSYIAHGPSQQIHIATRERW